MYRGHGGNWRESATTVYYIYQSGGRVVKSNKTPAYIRQCICTWSTISLYSLFNIALHHNQYQMPPTVPLAVPPSGIYASSGASDFDSWFRAWLRLSSNGSDVSKICVDALIWTLHNQAPTYCYGWRKGVICLCAIISSSSDPLGSTHIVAKMMQHLPQLFS